MSKERKHGQRRADRACRGAGRVERPRAAKPRRTGTAPEMPPYGEVRGDRQLRSRQLRAAATEAGRLIMRLEAAIAVDIAPIGVRWLDDDEIDRRIKAGDPTAALDALTHAIHEMRIVAQWLERHIALRGN